MKKGLSAYYLFAIGIILGFFLTVQLKSDITSLGIITIPKLLALEKDVSNIEVEIENLNKSINELEQKLKEYETSLSESGSIYNSMMEEWKKIRNYAGLEKISGPGIIITMNDSKKEIGIMDNPELYVIHDIDVLEVVNELKAAGAEAISINGERILGTSNIECGGPIIIIDGKRHAAPFIIKAIGDPKVLEASILAPDSYIDLMEYTGIEIDVKKAENIVMDGYKAPLKLNYQKSIKEGESK
ncbi:DUF881 domain-containing protein [Lutispora thermophila]|uniref:Uncharacterized conserved protein YlxW, UPF0749 family n=1 Tax=Lutispora thermophila DSM 19022 TaxID=1122184 RepID=A0A1M6CN84_9FIRM|nr:DUF881 domain-containing protein [Lutispora thermophila]SHI62466.1 Uncharacterized conserved protein YlxW, UPF0749 family [Lutispora thermophila DSM 19022]